MKILQQSLFYFFIYTISLGLIYPIIVTGIGQLIFDNKSNGSLITFNDKTTGSRFIGQDFKNEKYFWGRPSATSSAPYNPLSSGGSNMSLTNPALQKVLKERAESLNTSGLKIPIDLITASGSGLDPEISIASAKFQVPRISKARGMNEEKVLDLVNNLSDRKLLGVIGEPRVNVLMLNMELDKL